MSRIIFFFLFNPSHLFHEIENKNFLFFFGHDPIKEGGAHFVIVLLLVISRSRLPPLQFSSTRRIRSTTYTIFITPKMVTAAQYQMVVMALWLRRPRGQIKAQE